MDGKIFLSYSRKDKQFVDKLSADLEARGAEVWIDRGDIVAGGAWREQIVTAIKTGSIFLLVLSPNSIGSENVNRELTLAERDGKTIIPLLYKSVEIPDSMAYQLAGLQHVDFSVGTYQENLKKLLATPAILKILELKSGEGVRQAVDLPKETKPLPSSGLNKRIGPLPIWGWGGAGVILFLVLIFGLRGILGGGSASTLTPTHAEVANLLEETSTKPPQFTETLTPTETKEPTSTETALNVSSTIENTATETPSPTPIPTISTSIIVQRGGSTAEMILVADCLLNESGKYNVKNCDLTLNGTGLEGAFFMDAVPVTNEQYAAFLNENSYSVGAVRDWFNYDHPDGGIAINSSGEWYRKEGHENFPVIAVSWDWAEKFCTYYGGELPSEDEWIKAARGNGDFFYPWGNNTVNLSYANYNNRIDKTIPVKSNTKNVSPFGVWDMAGNVWEWTSTQVIEKFALKGGSYKSNDFLLRIDQRKIELPDVLSGDFGFRCMCSPADSCYTGLAPAPTPTP